ANGSQDGPCIHLRQGRTPPQAEAGRQSGDGTPCQSAHANPPFAVIFLGSVGPNLSAGGALASRAFFILLAVSLGETTAGPVARFVDRAAGAGLTGQTVIGGERTKDYILETTGGGAAILDFDADGWPDVFLVNGARTGE